MLVFWLINCVLFAIILLLFLVLSCVWPPDSPWAPWWTTTPEIARRMCELAHVTKKSVVYDLGCGTGTALIIAAKEFGAKGVGIEIDPIRVANAAWNFWRFGVRGKIRLIKSNFFNINLSPASVVFIYLVPKALERLTPKMLKELHKGTIIISYIYPMPEKLFKGKLLRIAEDKEKKILVYKII